MKNVDLPKLDLTIFQSGRLKTFTSWPYSTPDECTPEKMAAAGFIAIGGKDEPDLAECFVCLKQLDGWDPEDDPWSEHVKHQPECPFVKLNKQDELTWTVEEFFEMMRVYKLNILKKKLEDTLAQGNAAKEQAAAQIPKLYRESIRNSRKF